MSDLPFDVARAGPAVQEHFLRMVAAGQSPRFAEMAALQQPPGTRGTDRAFMEGRLNNEQFASMHAPLARRMLSEAKAAGISTSGKFYVGGLADKRAHLDPKAWVDSVSDIKKVAQERDLYVQGIVEYSPPEKPPRKSVDIAPDILREQVRKELKRDPALKRSDAVERVKDRIVPNWKRGSK